MVIFYQIWRIKIYECKQHFHEKTEFYLKTLSVAHTLGMPWQILLNKNVKCLTFYNFLENIDEIKRISKNLIK